MKTRKVAKRVVLASAAAILWGTGIARATPVSFDFLGANATGSSLHFTGTPNPPGLEVTVTASGGTLYQTANRGLGVGDDKLVGHKEAVNFDFSPENVALDYVIFTAVESANNWNSNNADNVSINIVDAGGSTLYSGPISISSTGKVALVLDGQSHDLGDAGAGKMLTLSDSQRTGMRFSIGGVDGNDGFGIGGLTVEYSGANSGSSEVTGASAPLPSSATAGFAVLSAFGAAYLMGRPRRRVRIA